MRFLIDVIAGLMIVFFTTTLFGIEPPIDDLSHWESLSFSDIPPNQVAIKKGALTILVRDSASPLIYQLEQRQQITGIEVDASWKGELPIPASATQGERGADDFVLKFGIIEAGERQLSWFQKQIAPEWIKRLHRLAPSGAGVKRIHFFTTTQQKSLLGKERIHPLSDLLYETRVTWLDGPGPFEINQQFDKPKDTLGLWISTDGDDLGANFELTITRIKLLTAGQSAKKTIPNSKHSPNR